MIEDTMNDLQPAPAPFNSFTMGPPHYYRPLPSISGCSALSPPNHQITAAPSRPASSAPGGSGRGVSSAPPSRSPLFLPRGRASRLSSSPTPSITPPPHQYLQCHGSRGHHPCFCFLQFSLLLHFLTDKLLHSFPSFLLLVHQALGRHQFQSQDHLRLPEGS